MRVRTLDTLARRQLDAGGPWRVHSVFARACNLMGPDGELLGIVAAGVGAAPATLVLEPLTPQRRLDGLLAPGLPAIIDDDRLVIGTTLTLDLVGAQLWEPATIRRLLEPDEIRRRLAEAAEIGAREAPAGGLAPLLEPFCSRPVSEVNPSPLDVPQLRGLGDDPSPPDPLRGANIGFADIISRARERGRSQASCRCTASPGEGQQSQYDSPSPARGRGGRGVRGSPVVERARALLASLLAAIHAEQWSDAAAAAHGLSGLGPGLTPAGDDLLVGLALGLRAAHGTLPALLADALTEAVVGRTTDLAAARVRHAVAGHPDEYTHRVLTALVMDQSAAGLPAAVRALLEYGHSSGADTLVGLLAGVGSWVLGLGAAHRDPHHP